jgi:hypothetical protein
MNPQLKTTLAIAGIAAVICVIAFIGWKSFGPAPGDMDQATVAAHIAAKNATAKNFH